MKALIIVSGMLAFFIKLAIHIYLDIKNNRSKGLKPANMLPFLYFFPYMEEVKPAYQTQKKLCDLFYILFILLVAYSLIFY